MIKKIFIITALFFFVGCIREPTEEELKQRAATISTLEELTVGDHVFVKSLWFSTVYEVKIEYNDFTTKFIKFRNVDDTTEVEIGNYEDIAKHYTVVRKRE